MSKRILHAEKEESVATLLKTLLVARGHEVEHTADGKEAQQKLIAKDFDLVVVGDEVEDIDGIGLIIKLREVNSQVPVIFVSKVWRDARIYRQLVKDLRVTLVIHRPIKAGLFGAQLESILIRSLPSYWGSWDRKKPPCVHCRPIICGYCQSGFLN